MKLFYRYAIDIFNRTRITGWCYSRLLKRKPIRLEFRDGKTLLGECIADIEREDLRDLGLHPDGKCGFSFFFPPEVTWRGEDPIDVSVKGKRTRLIRLHKKECGREIVVAAPIKKRLRRLLGEKRSLPAPTFFMHIPKTAGTSFNTFVRSHCSGAIITHLESYAPSEYSRIAKEYQYIAGHLPVAVAKAYFPVDTFLWYTLLREPYSHVHSHINWLRGIAMQSDSSFFYQHHRVFQDIAQAMNVGSHLDYQQLQRLVDSVAGVLGEVLQNCQTRYFLDTPGSTVGLADVAEAMENLKLFHTVGLTERLADFEKNFLTTQGLAVPLSGKTLNKAKFGALYDHRDPITKEIVRPLVEADLALYQKAQGDGVRLTT